MDAVRKIRLIIADDHDMVRRGLAVFIQGDPRLCLVGEARNGKEAVELCEQLEPDVVLIDVTMPVMDGPTAIREIRQRNPTIQCIALSAYSNGESVQGAINAGAISYLMKNASNHELAHAILDAADGKATIVAEAIQVLVREAQRPRPVEGKLTAREREVLQYLKRGIGNDEIARELNITVSTVKKHVSNTLDKLNIPSRTAVIAMATRHKF